MVVIFSNEKARNFLLEKGFVWTVRSDALKLGKNWMTDKRHGFKLADVSIEDRLPLPTLSSIGLFVDESGFDSYEDWVEAIKSLNRGKIPEHLWIHKVTLKKEVS